MAQPLSKNHYYGMCVKRTFSSLECSFFHLEHQQTIILGLFRPKTKKDQILIVQLKPWINPFGKITTMMTL